MNTPLRFGFRHPLHTMPTGFELEPRIGPGTVDTADDFPVTAQFRFIGRKHLHRPALPLGIARIHAEQIPRKQGRLVTARTGPDFQQHTALVVGIARQQQFLQLQLQRRKTRLAGRDFLFGKVAHLRIAAQPFRRRQILLALAKGLIVEHHRLNLRPLTRQTPELIHIPRRFRRRQQQINFAQAIRK